MHWSNLGTQATYNKYDNLGILAGKTFVKHEYSLAILDTKGRISFLKNYQQIMLPPPESLYTATHPLL